jgi:hypothetical protein
MSCRTAGIARSSSRPPDTIPPMVFAAETCYNFVRIDTPDSSGVIRRKPRKRSNPQRGMWLLPEPGSKTTVVRIRLRETRRYAPTQSGQTKRTTRSITRSLPVKGGAKVE